jgi:hypothetical protein
MILRPVARPVLRSVARSVVGGSGGIPLVINGYLAIPGATVTRNSPAHEWNSQGLLQQYAANQPVIGYNPATGALRGLAVFPASTNSLINSRDPTAAGWGNFGTPDTTLNATGVDGVANAAATITDNDAVNFEGRTWSFACPNDSNINGVRYVIRKTTSAASFPGLRLAYSSGTGITSDYTLNTDTGVLTQRSTGAAADKTAVLDFGDWWGAEIYVANNGTGNTTISGIIFAAVNTDGGSEWVSSAQGSTVFDITQVRLNSSEIGPIIVTGASAEPRAADNISITSIPWYNQSEGVMAGRAITSGYVASQQIFELNDGTSSERHRVYASSNLWLSLTTDGGVTQQNINSGVSAVTTAMQQIGFAFGYKENDFGFSVNGNTVVTDTSGTIPTITTLLIGRASGGTPSQYLHGWISDLTYYPVRLPNATLQALSSG